MTSQRPWSMTVFGILGITIALAGFLALIGLFSLNAVVVSWAVVAPFAGLFVALVLRLAAGIGMLMMRKWVLPVFIVIVVLSGLSVAVAMLSDLGVGAALTGFIVEIFILWQIWRYRELLK